MASLDYSATWPYLLVEALRPVKRLADMGIYPPTFYQLKGKCTRHGEVKHRIETIDGPPQEGDQIQCLAHLYDLSVVHWVRVTEWSETQ